MSEDKKSPAPCETCGMRARYEQNPRSLLGRLWKWHTGWRPGWKKYLGTLDDAERAELVHRLGLKPR